MAGRDTPNKQTQADERGGVLGERTKSEDEAALLSRDKYSTVQADKQKRGGAGQGRSGQGRAKARGPGTAGSDPVCITYSTCTPTAGNLDRHKQAGKASKLPGPGTEVACLTTRSARVR